MILEKYTKQPAERKDYDVDYTPWFLSDPADSLDDVAVSVDCLTDPVDAALVVDSVQITDRVAKLWVRGGTDRHKYKLTLLATTTVGRIDESELTFTIKDH